MICGKFVNSFFDIGLSAAAGTVELFNNGIKIDKSRDYSVLGTDFNFIYKNIDLRLEYIQQAISSSKNNLIANSAQWKAWYSQAAYRFKPSPWEAIIRVGSFLSADAEGTQHQIAIGIDYWFTTTTVFKFAYAVNNGQTSSSANNNQILAQMVFKF